MRFPQSRRRDGTPEGDVEFDLTVDAGLLAFQGHFPGNPVLPGVVQLDWAIHFGREAFGPLGSFAGVEHLKFMEIIRPEEPVVLRVSFDASRKILRFAFESESRRKSSGLVRFTQET